MTNLEELLKKRSNITFFRQDKVPSKEIIEDILEKTHNLMPHKNNLWNYEIEVYGPEHNEEKKYVAMSTVCSEAGKKFKNAKTQKDFDELEELYDLWIESHKQKRKLSEKLTGIHFNNQVRAPYLLVYTQKQELITDKQKNSDYYKKGRLNQVFDVEVNIKNNMWLIQSGMHSILTTAFALEKGLDASFCKCFFYNTHIHSNILRKAAKKTNNIAFLLGIGYKDETKHQYKTYVPKADIDEIIKWV